MSVEATVWTEGKTDWKHLRRAFQVLGVQERIRFKEIAEDFGDDNLLVKGGVKPSQCGGAKVGQ